MLSIALALFSGMQEYSVGPTMQLPKPDSFTTPLDVMRTDSGTMLRWDAAFGIL